MFHMAEEVYEGHSLFLSRSDPSDWLDPKTLLSRVDAELEGHAHSAHCQYDHSHRHIQLGQYYLIRLGPEKISSSLSNQPGNLELEGQTKGNRQAARI